MMIKYVNGGVCAPRGFTASGVYCGIRKNRTKKDLALIVSKTRANAAAVYTTNLVKGAPILVTKENISDGYARAIICNSGNANTCNANGVEIAKEMCALVASHTDIAASDVIVASTGVIGRPLSTDPIKNAMEELVKGLNDNGSEDAASAILTTDVKMKEVAVGFEIDGIACHIGGIAKGSGMIHPNMATMLVFLTSDVAIDTPLLQKALKDDADDTFNMISVDGDTSTNDTLAIMANGEAGNARITKEGEAYEIFKKALNAVTTHLCREIAADGEGATKLLECDVFGAGCVKCARKIAKSVICSSLVKTAMFGADANWGRVLCAIGYSGADVNVTKIDVWFESVKGKIKVCENGAGVDFSEEKAKEILLESEIKIKIDLKSGDASAHAWGCDLTYDYVKINGDYRT